MSQEEEHVAPWRSQKKEENKENMGESLPWGFHRKEQERQSMQA